MAESHWSRNSLRIGLTEVRRTLRGLRGDQGQLVMFAGFELFMLLGTAIGAYLILEFGSSLETFPLPNALRGTFALLWVFGAFMETQRTVSQRPRIDADELMLTTVSSRTVTGGLLVAECLRGLAYIAVPSLVLGSAFVYATGSILSIVMIPLALVLYATTIVLTGFGLGISVALLIARSRFVARHKTVLGGSIVILFFGGYMLFQLPSDMLPVTVSQASLAWLPMGWFADLLFFGSPLTVSRFQASSILVGSFIGLSAGSVIVERLTAALWYGGSVDPDSEDDDRSPVAQSIEGFDALDSALGVFALPQIGLSTPTRRVAQKALIQTQRNPSKLSFLIVGLAFAFGPLGTVIQQGGADTLIPVLVALVVPWLAGAAFAINPLGDEGAVLPVTVTSAVSSRHFVHGLIVPGAIIGVPAVILFTVLAGAFSPYTAFELGGLVFLGIVLTVAALPLAPAIGMWFPRFSAIDAGRSREVVPPSITALVLYTVPIGVLGGFAALAWLAPTAARALLVILGSSLPSFVLALLAEQGLTPLAGVANWFQGIGDFVGAIAVDWMQFGGFGLPLLLVLLLGVWSYRAAVKRFETYSMP